MNISNIFSFSDGLDSFYYNASEAEMTTSSIIEINIILFSFLTNSCVIWLISSGIGNGIAAEFWILNAAVSELLISLQFIFNRLAKKVWSLWIAFAFFKDLDITIRPLFQCLICVERYLAVIYPVIFLKCKPLRCRLVCAAIVWITGFLLNCFSFLTEWLLLSTLYIVYYFMLFVLFFFIQLFCLVAVLRALKQPRPGDRKNKEQNNMKKTAFNLILISFVSTMLIYISYLLLILPQWILEIGNSIGYLSYICFFLAPSVQPLAFVYRVGKQQFIKSK